MLLQCSNCAGSVTANDEAIRRGVVLCDYCHTALRINETGRETYKKQLLKHRPPHDIEIKRSRNAIKICIPMQIQGTRIPVLFGGRFIFVLVVTLLIGLFSWTVLELRGQLLFGPMVIFFLAAGPMLSTTKPYILLKDNLLQIPVPLSPRSINTPIADIKQLYVTVNRLSDQVGNRTQYNLFALKKDGSRTRLYGDFESLNAALYVEEWLEIKLNIFDLPVYGDTKTTIKEVAASQSQSDDPTICYACTAPLKFSTAVREQGYITCAYCHTITLLYTKDSHKLILGQPIPEKMIYRVVVRRQFAGVLNKKEKQAVLLLSHNKIKEAPFNKTLSGKVVKRFGIRKVFVPRNVSVKDWFSGKAIAQYEEALGYSHDAGLANVPMNMLDYVENTVSYVVTGQIGSDHYSLIPNVADLPEAAYIVETLNNFLVTHLSQGN